MVAEFDGRSLDPAESRTPECTHFQVVLMSDRRIPEMDGVRGMAILMVLFWHFVVCNVGEFTPEPSWRVPDAIMRLSWTGVDLFLVLSGFLITGILLDHTGSPNYFSTFYTRRAYRIAPLYYVQLAIYTLMLAIGASEMLPWLRGQRPPTWTYAVFLQNVWIARHDVWGPDWISATWSLAVEEQFYLVLPIAVAALPRRGLIVLAMVAIAVAPVTRSLVQHRAGYVLFPCRMDSLSMGLLLAILTRTPRAWVTAMSLRRLFPPVGVVLSVAVLVLRVKQWMPDLLYTITAAMYATLILTLLTTRDGMLARMFRNRALRWCGAVCFGLYLLHQPVQCLCFAMIAGKAPGISGISDVLIVAVAAVLVFCLATFSWRYLEGPMVRRGQACRY